MADPRFAIYFPEFGTNALILRRGPSDGVHAIAWDLSNDEFQAGGWLKAKVRVERCALSPSGRYFLFCSYRRNRIDHTGHGASLTIISRPPWFTALTLWQGYSSLWYGGGRFLDERMSKSMAVLKNIQSTRCPIVFVCTM